MTCPAARTRPCRLQVQLACELDKVIKQITGVSFAEGHDPSAVDGAEGSAAQAQHGPGQGVPGQQGQGQLGQDQGEQGVAQGTRKKKKNKKNKNKQAGVQGQQGVGPAGGPGGAATTPPRHTPIVFPAALSRPIATAAAGVAHPPVLPMSQHPEKFSAPLKPLPSMAVPLMTSMAASAAPSIAPAPVATAATLAMGEAAGAGVAAPGAAAAAMGPSTAKPLAAAAVAAMNERQRLELLASAAQTWVVVLDYSASSSGYVGGKVGRATAEFPTRGQGACTSWELVLLMAEGVLQEQTLMAGVATPKSCVPLPLAASFLRPMKLLLAQLAAGVGYEPLAEHQVRQPAPPPAWSVPLVLFGPLVRQYAGPSSVAAATALAERRERDIEAQLGHRSVRALLQVRGARPGTRYMQEES